MAFTKGQSGNRAGRPAGKTPGATIRKAIEARSTEILQAVIVAAVNGDMATCKMLLDRITPVLKPVATSVTLSLSDDAALADQGAAILKSALSAQAKIVEIDEVIRRVENLEGK